MVLIPPLSRTQGLVSVSPSYMATTASVFVIMDLICKLWWRPAEAQIFPQALASICSVVQANQRAKRHPIIDMTFVTGKQVFLIFRPYFYYIYDKIALSGSKALCCSTIKMNKVVIERSPTHFVRDLGCFPYFTSQIMHFNSNFIT